MDWTGAVSIRTAMANRGYCNFGSKVVVADRGVPPSQPRAKKYNLGNLLLVCPHSRFDHSHNLTMLAPSTKLCVFILSTLTMSIWAAPTQPTKLGMDTPKGVPRVNDHTGVAVNMPHAKRVTCEFVVPGENPEPASEPFAGVSPVRRDVCHG